MKFHIWSIEHRAWLKPYINGFTLDLNEAGQYNEDQARDIVETSAGMGFHDVMFPVDYRTPHDTGYRIRRRTDGRYSKGGMVPTFTKAGKIWNGIGPLKNHLLRFGVFDYQKKQYVVRDVYRDCDIIGPKPVNFMKVHEDYLKRSDRPNWPLEVVYRG